MGKAILLTGAPGSGKTTALRQIVARLERPVGGFYTQDVRRAGKRVGFQIVTLDGHEGTLAHVDRKGGPRVGKYGVDLAALESTGVESIRRALASGALVVIDEIGPMELLSDAFRQAVLDALDGDAPLLGTLVQRPTPFTAAIRARPHVQVLELTVNNREEIVARVLDLL